MRCQPYKDEQLNVCRWERCEMNWEKRKKVTAF